MTLQRKISINMTFKRFSHLKFKNFHLSTKLLITYILLTVLPMAFLGSIAYVQYTESIEEQIGEYIPRLLHQSNENIENHFKELAALPDLIYNSDNVMGILRKEEYESQAELNRDSYIIRSFFSRTFLGNNSNEILGVFLVSNHHIFEHSRTTYKGFDIENINDQDGIRYQGDMEILLPYQSNLVFQDNTPYFLLKKDIIDVDNRRTIGTLVFAVETAFIERVFANLDHEDKADIWLMNSEGRIIYHTDLDRIGQTYNEIQGYPTLSGSFHTDYGDNTLISVDESANMGWILAHSIETKFLTERTDIVTNVIIVMFIILVLVATLISIYLALTVVRPIKTLGNLMKEVEKGNFQVQIPINSHDEVGYLAQSFDSMITQVRELIQKNYEKEIRQKNAELYALQSQINPHFMYNTLETIGMAVEDGDSEVVVDMVTILGRMLRFSLSNKERIIPISKEVAHIRDYLSLQTFRFEERLSFQINETIDSERYYTPKFILQPIVENAIKYGLEKRRELTIELSVKKESIHPNEESVVYIIRDNGPGITHEELNRIRKMLQSEPMIKRDSGFGITNVHARLVTMFGDPYGVSINSTEGNGTEVIIRTKLVEQSEIAEYSDSGEVYGDANH
ncbi:sensor histidine kinase [Cytobacillus gottheilii]|uniref:sensor histidine kinase n=1 Tax=Cytobacillus gottheilii TaxID=859144 RepID=UPI002494B571|nr:sensor histidine kinase [Cytobacillus gottheilii]